MYSYIRVIIYASFYYKLFLINKTVPFSSKSDQNIISLYIVTVNEEWRDNKNLEPGHREELRVKYSTSQWNPFLSNT